MPRPRHLPNDAYEPSLDTYFREINQTALLTAEEERALAVRIVAGDIEARDRMVRANLRLVVNLARSYVGKGLSLSDLIEEGNLGLLRAVEGFDPSMNTRFSTYASYWIKQSIQRALVNTSKTIRIPTYMIDLLTKWQRATLQLQKELNRAPTPEEVGRRVGLSKKKLAIIQKALQVSGRGAQSDQPENGWSMEEMILDARSKSPETEMQESEDRQYLLGMLNQMDPREGAVLRMRFGLDGDEPKTLKEIGECLHLTRERVRQIENQALRKLSERLALE